MQPLPLHTNDTNASNTFDVGDIDVELCQFLTGSVHALVHRLQNLFWVLFHPAAEQKVKVSVAPVIRLNFIATVVGLFKLHKKEFRDMVIINTLLAVSEGYEIL